MNSNLQPTRHRLTAFALALVMTLGTLSAVDHLATSDVAPAQMARMEAQQAARI